MNKICWSKVKSAQIGFMECFRNVKVSQELCGKLNRLRGMDSKILESEPLRLKHIYIKPR